MVGLALFGRAPLFLPARSIVIIANPREYSEAYKKGTPTTNSS